ncbi:MAG: NAD(P)H-dependent oxidoreductase [Micrococcaceae bacterium]
MSLEEAPFRLVALSAGTSEPSTSRMLVDRAAQATSTHLKESGCNISIAVIELAPMAAEIAQSLVTGFPQEKVQQAIEKVAQADAVIVATPVYKAGISGLFKSFIDLLDNDLLVAKPVLLTATAGTARHAMVIDEQMRPLFAFLRTLTAPTSVFAAPEDWGSAELGQRIDRAAFEMATLISSRVGSTIAESGWSKYQHQFAGNATRSERTSEDTDFTTDLMKLARGQSLSSQSFKNSKDK